MLTQGIRGLGPVALAVIALVVNVARAGADVDMEKAYEQLVKDRAAALVTVKFVLKVNMGAMFGGMDDQESEQEISGVMIAPDGLVLVSNTDLGGRFVSMMRRFAGSMGGDMSAVPTDLKVLVGDDTEGVDAELLARDTELDLGWVKIKDPGEKKYAAVDFSVSTKPRLGQKLLMLTRMGKYFDRAPLVQEAQVAGFAQKPRQLYVPSGAGGLGLPVYTTDGQLVGFTILQMQDVEDAGANPLGMLSQMSDMESMMAGFILPAPEILKATKRAQETAAASEADEVDAEQSSEADESDTSTEESDDE